MNTLLDEQRQECNSLQSDLLRNRELIIVSNRGPVSIQVDENGETQFQRGGGGLVTALLGLTQHVNACWVACSLTDTDRTWGEGVVPLGDSENSIRVKFISPEPQAFEAYYNVIANPLLWFLQHSMWDFVRAPTIDNATWYAWENGYVEVNRQFADVIASLIEGSQRQPLVMLHDYHLYLVPQFVRQKIHTRRRRLTLTHFIHIPWPGAEDWGMMPPAMRKAILEGLCAVDLIGFQTRDDGLNFIRTCESYLPRANVNYRHGRVWFRNHATYVRDFPISIDVAALQQLAGSDEVSQHYAQLSSRFGDRQLIVRVDRTEPSKNIVRGFQAFDEMLDLHPEHRGKIQFLALMVPSRMEVEEYQSYLDELMSAAGRVNVKHGDSEWEPVRVLVGENYARAVAAMQMYDVLLVNSIADGMNLVAKEGPIVNKKNGVVILSERTGARQQLAPGATVISPCDIHATAEALHQGLVMPEDERQIRAERLKRLIESEDISDWLCNQLKTISNLNL